MKRTKDRRGEQSKRGEQGRRKLYIHCRSLVGVGVCRTCPIHLFSFSNASTKHSPISM